MFLPSSFKALLIVLFLVYGVAFSADNPVLEIAAVPGKAICQSGEKVRGGLPIKTEFCVTQGNFSHDTYQLKIDGKSVLKGIDDETVKGISSSYNGESVQLTCIPKNEAPSDVSPEKVAAVQKMMPKLSREEAVKSAILMETVEVGRSCVVLIGSESLIEVLVKSE